MPGSAGGRLAGKFVIDFLRFVAHDGVFLAVDLAGAAPHRAKVAVKLRLIVEFGAVYKRAGLAQGGQVFGLALAESPSVVGVGEDDVVQGASDEFISELHGNVLSPYLLPGRGGVVLV